ncbi:hypothetical protein, partial [Phyllobacterium calauticae]
SRANPVNATLLAIPKRSSKGFRCDAGNRSYPANRILNICILVKTYVHYKDDNDDPVTTASTHGTQALKRDGNAAKQVRSDSF